MTHGAVKRVGVAVNIEYDVRGVEQVGGFETGPDPDAPPVDFEVSKGGDSGSVWMIVYTT